MGKAYKILMLVENGPAPADLRVWPEATSLRDHGYQVSIICPMRYPDYQEPYICIEDIHIYRYKLPTFGHKYVAYLVEYSIAMFMTFYLSFKVLFRHGFDIIHAANSPDLKRFGLVPAEAGLKCGRSFLLAYVGVMEVQDGVENCLYALRYLVYQCGRQDKEMLASLVVHPVRIVVLLTKPKDRHSLARVSGKESTINR